MDSKAELHGLVLSGGHSRRMGRDKGLIRTDSVAWVNRAGALLESLDLPVSIMVREAQLADYQTEVYPSFELLPDQDLVVGGPLKGLLSFYQHYPEKDVLVLPCDMPKVTKVVLMDLLIFRMQHPTHDVWVYKAGERIQPFPGIYAACHLAKIYRRLQLDTADKVCLMDVVHNGQAAILESGHSVAEAFTNANLPEDIG